MADSGKLAEMALRVWGYKQGEVVSLMIYLGDRLGIYRALAGAGPVTAGALAARTGLHPRWLLEWAGAAVPRGRVQPLPAPRCRRPRQPLLRGPALTR
ncbi:MAG TPA: hypothetical protein VFV73_36150 [Streptosporangiaceae bacterium]|nr:hypothetical protein [Streptosporangiaceae bacterium]